MQKVRSSLLLKHELLIKLLLQKYFPHGTCSAAYVLYLAFEEGSP